MGSSVRAQSHVPRVSHCHRGNWEEVGYGANVDTRMANVGFSKVRVRRACGPGTQEVEAKNRLQSLSGTQREFKARWDNAGRLW